jgi:hypothetical protein
MDLTKSTAEALSELQQKGLKQIQVETAAKWCGRAAAARLLGMRERDVTEFAHEAIEHAALSGDEKVLSQIRAALVQLDIEV